MEGRDAFLMVRTTKVIRSLLLSFPAGLVLLPIFHAICRVIDPHRMVERRILELIDQVEVLFMIESHYLSLFTLNINKSTALPVLPARCR